MSTAILEVRDLSVRFDAHEAVRTLGFEVHEGETLALVGESGCGKSTTALAIMRLLGRHATLSGQVLFEGRDLLGLPEASMRSIRGNAISMIFQEPMTSLNPVLTIGRQLTEVLERHLELRPREARTRAIELLERVRIPDPARRLDDYPHQLSGGQRQRVMIAMAIACRPRLLVADEPTTALDVTIQAQILELIDELRREFSMSVLLITHDLGVVGQYADRVAVMYAGEKLEEGRVHRIFTRPAHAYTRGLLGASLTLERHLHYRQTRLAEVRASVDAHTGERAFTLSRAAPENVTYVRGALTSGTVVRDVAQRVANGATQAVLTEAMTDISEPLLRVKHLSTRYGTKTAVDDVSFDIARGETVGLVGESGCGKSTLSRTLVRLLDPAHGRIVLDGTDITRLDARAMRVHRRKIQMIFQDPFASLNPRHTIQTILDTALRVHGVATAAERSRRITRTLDRVGLPGSAARRHAHEFSGGQRQRIGIARALIVEPSLVICDEPVSALDVSIRAQVLNLLVELKQEFGLSYLFISHDLSVVRYIADRVLVMNAGTIVESGDHDSIWVRPAHDYTRSLIAAVPTANFALEPVDAGDRSPALHLIRKDDEVSLPASFYRFAI